MTALFYIGGTGNTSSTAHWATSSGGTGPHAVPTTGDTATFDTNSGTGTATVDATLSCDAVTIDKAGLTVLCNAPLNTGTGAMTLKTGTLRTNGQNCTWFAYQGAPTGAGVRTLDLGSSTITLTSTIQPWLLTSTTNYTFVRGTSTIVFSGNGPNLISLGSQTHYKMQISNVGSAVVSIAGGGNKWESQLKIIGGNSTTGIVETQSLDLYNNGAFAGDLTILGNSPTNRVMVRSSAPGNRRTYTAATRTISNVTFQDITAAGPAAPFVGSSIGDAGGNASIQFDDPLPLYRVGAGGNWSDASYWFTDAVDPSDGVTPLTPRVPLAQDTVIVDARATGTIAADMPRIGSRLDLSGFAGTLNLAVGVTVYGSVTFSNDPAFTLTGTGTFTLGGRHSQLLTTNGKAIPGILRLEAPGGSYQLQDDLTVLGTFNHMYGAWDPADHDVTLGSFTSTAGTNDRTVLMGSGDWTLTGTGTVWNVTSNTALVIDPGTSTIRIADTSAAAKTFIGAGRTYHDIAFDGGTGTLTLGGSTFATPHFAPGSIVTFTADSTTTVADLDAVGTEVAPITLRSTTLGTPFALRKFGGTVSANWLVLSDSTATGTAQWFAGRDSVDGGNNHGWQFGDPAASGNAFFIFFAGRKG